MTEEQNIQPEPEALPESYGEDLPFYKIWWEAISKPSIEQAHETLATPNATMGRAYGWLALSWFVGSIFGFLIILMVILVFSMDSGFDSGDDTVKAILIGVGVFVGLGVVRLLGITLHVGVAHGIAKLFGGEGSFQRLFFGYAAVYAPFLIGISFIGLIPMIGYIAIGALYLYKTYVAALTAQAEYGISMGQAIVALLAWPALSLAFNCSLAFVAMAIAG